MMRRRPVYPILVLIALLASSCTGGSFYRELQTAAQGRDVRVIVYGHPDSVPADSFAQQVAAWMPIPSEIVTRFTPDPGASALLRYRVVWSFSGLDAPPPAALCRAGLEPAKPDNGGPVAVTVALCRDAEVLNSAIGLIAKGDSKSPDAVRQVVDKLSRELFPSYAGASTPAPHAAPSVGIGVDYGSSSGWGLGIGTGINLGF